MPVSVIFHRLGRVEVEGGATILEASQRFGLFHAASCGGRGECSTCRVWIMAGTQNCSAVQEVERRMLAAHNLKPPIRLACQARMLGPMRVQILLRNEHEVQNVIAESTAIAGTLPGVHLPLVVLKAGLHDFDDFVENNVPYEAIQLLQKFRTLAENLVSELGGEACEGCGPAFSAAFGLNGDVHTAIPSALGCARRIIVAFQEVNEYLERHCDLRLQLGCGLHVGETVAGHLGGPGRRQLCLLGETPRITERLLQLTKSAKAAILISEPVFAVVRDRFPITRAFSARLPGKTERLNVFEVQPQSSGIAIGAAF